MKARTTRAPVSATGTRGRTIGTTRWGDTTRAGARMTGAPSRRTRVRRWWRRTRVRTERRVRRVTQTVTAPGWFVILATLGAAIAGLGSGWVEAAFVAVVGAVLIVTAIPFLAGNRAYLIRIRLDRDRVVVGDDVTAVIEVENGSARPALPATADLPVGEALRELAIPVIGPRGIAQLPVEIAAPARGVFEVGPITLSRRDPLGLLHREAKWRDRHLVHVHPRTVTLPPGSAGLVRDLEGAASRRLTDADLSFHAVREYAHGDARRNIHWKSTAKTGVLMVRQYEESQTARTAILFDAVRAGYASSAEFELGVSVAASLSLQAVHEGRERFIASQWSPGRVRPSVDGLEELPAQTAPLLLDAWAELAHADEEARSIDALTRQLARSRRPLSVVFAVTGSAAGTAQLRRAATAFDAGVAVVAIRCDLLADPQAQRADACTLLTVGMLSDLPRLLLRGAAA